MNMNKNPRALSHISLAGILAALLTACGGGISETTTTNHAPVANNDALTIDEDAAATATPNVLANDSDQDKDDLSIVAFTFAQHGTVTNNGNGTFNYAPDANFSGSDSFEYIVNDGRGGVATGTVNLTVNPSNDAPVAANDSYTFDEDAANAAGNVLDNDVDPDGDALTVAVKDNVTHGTLTLNADGSFTYVPSANFNGNDSFTYTVADASETVEATVNIVVNAVNDNPVATSNSASTDRITPVVINVLGDDSDVDGDALHIIGWTSTSSGSLVNNGDGTFTFAPDNLSVSSESFSYTISDDAGGSATASVNIDIASGWGKAGYSYNTGTQASAYQVKVDDNGNAMLVWTQSDGNRQVLWAQRFDSVSGWQALEKVDHDKLLDLNLGNSNNPSVVMDDAGNITVSWIQHHISKGIDDAWVNRYVVGSGWQGATLLEQDDLNIVSAPQLAVTAENDVVAVWVQQGASRNELYVNRFDTNPSVNNWTGKFRIDKDAQTVPVAITFGNPSNPRMVADSQGNITVVWLQVDSGTAVNELLGDRYVATAASWADPQIIDSQAAAPQVPQMALTGNGEVTVSWIQSDGARNAIYSNQYVSTEGGWLGANKVDLDSTAAETLANSDNLSLSAGTSTTALVWRQYDTTNARYDLWARRFSRVNNLVGDAERIDANDQSISFDAPRIVVDSMERTTVIWSQNDDTSISHIYTNRYLPDSGGWQGALAINDVSEEFVSSPNIAGNKAGQVFAVWLQRVGVGPYPDVWASRFDQMQNVWSTAQHIDDSEGVLSSTPFVATNSSGIAVAAWNRYLKSAQVLWYNEFR